MGACKPRGKASSPWPGAPGATMLLTGVQLTGRQHGRVALQAHIASASGDGQQLLLTDITVRTPEGATLTTQTATWDANLQRLRASDEVQVLQAGGHLAAPGATLCTRTGELTLDGPVRGQGQTRQTKPTGPPLRSVQEGLSPRPP